jgi:hypothetical protein
MNVSTIDWRGTNLFEWVDNGAAATVIDFHHLRITTPSKTGAGTILSVNQLASLGRNRSFRAYDLAIDTYGPAARFNVGILGWGLKNPLFRNVLIDQYDYSVCVSGVKLFHGIGFECENLAIFNAQDALSIVSAGGSILLKNAHYLACNGDVRINAGGGAVALQGSHIDSTNNLEISHASAVSVTDTLFLSKDEYSTSDEQGTLRLIACTNVIVRNNEFGSVNKTKTRNPKRFSIRIGDGCKNVEIAGNHFGEGIGIIVPAGTANLRAFENRFLHPDGIDLICKEPTAMILKLPGEPGKRGKPAN